MIIIRGILGIGTVVFGFVIYPYYIENVIDPLVAIATTLHPGMNILEQTYLNLLPFVIFLLIIFFGVMQLLGKAGVGKREEP